ncbi:MAG TPA: hypothetical protein VGL92_05950 [Acidimicrobiia bacterium]
MNVEERVRHALAEHAAAVPDPPDRWSEVEGDAARLRRRNRWRAGGFTGLGLAAAISVVVLAVATLGDNGPQVVETRPADRPPETVEPLPEGTQLLWPFRSLAEAREWQDNGQPEGHSSWHADAEATALAFTTGYLGFTDVDRAVSTEIDGDEARVTVGYESEGGNVSSAAVLRLVRLGEGAGAPWEVVGTAPEEYFTITTPAPGAPVASFFTVAGRITGVDESIRVEVRQPSSALPLGVACCEPGGGENSPWTTTVGIKGATDPLLTVVASTGGHITGVERFVVVGVRSG